MSKLTEQECSFLRELVWKNALNLFEKKESLTHKSLIKIQKRFINDLNITGKNKYKTIEIFNNYFKNPCPFLGEQIFYNTINKKIMI
jgi:hypothetical protein